jgi:hypothetical protein
MRMMITMKWMENVRVAIDVVRLHQHQHLLPLVSQREVLEVVFNVTTMSSQPPLSMRRVVRQQEDARDFRGRNVHRTGGLRSLRRSRHQRGFHRNCYHQPPPRSRRSDARSLSPRPSPIPHQRRVRQRSGRRRPQRSLSSLLLPRHDNQLRVRSRTNRETARTNHETSRDPAEV